MAAINLQLDSFWVDKSKYTDAECQYYESISKASLTPLADEVAKARQRLIEIRGNIDEETTTSSKSNEILNTSANIADKSDKSVSKIETSKKAVSKTESTTKLVDKESLSKSVDQTEKAIGSVKCTDMVPPLKSILTEASAQIQPVDVETKKNVSLKDIIDVPPLNKMIANPSEIKTDSKLFVASTLAAVDIQSRQSMALVIKETQLPTTIQIQPPTPIQVEPPKPIKVEQAKPIQVDTQPIQVDTKPIQIDAKPIKVDVKPIQLEAKPIQVGPPKSIQIELPKPIQVEAKPIQVEAKPIQAELPKPVQVEQAMAVQVDEPKVIQVEAPKSTELPKPIQVKPPKTVELPKQIQVEAPKTIQVALPTQIQVEPSKPIQVDIGKAIDLKVAKPAERTNISEAPKTVSEAITVPVELVKPIVEKVMTADVTVKALEAAKSAEASKLAKHGKQGKGSKKTIEAAAKSVIAMPIAAVESKACDLPETKLETEKSLVEALLSSAQGASIALSSAVQVTKAIEITKTDDVIESGGAASPEIRKKGKEVKVVKEVVKPMKSNPAKVDATKSMREVPTKTFEITKSVEFNPIDAVKLDESDKPIATVNTLDSVESESANYASSNQTTKSVTDKTERLVIENKPAAAVVPTCNMDAIDGNAIKFLERKFVEFNQIVQNIQNEFGKFEKRLNAIESRLGGEKPKSAEPVCQKPAAVCKPVCKKPAPKAEEDDDVDLFGSDSEDDAAAEKIKNERIAAYTAKKSNKPALIAKSSILLDCKPWDDETDMKAMEVEVRKITMDGLLWGASKLVPLAYGIHKLQINCVVEDEKVSIDALQEDIEAIEDVQSVDIAAFNKI